MKLPPSIPGIATFHAGPDGLTRLRVASALATAEITLDGAHVTHFQPAGAAPVLFLSRSSHFAPGKPIRGGVPVCFPWFGPRAGHPESPAHGFARVHCWEAESLAAEESGSVTAILRLASDEQTRAHWPHDFIARLRIDVARQLTITLHVENTGPAQFQFEEALHTYFAVSDIREVLITGLEGAAYIDKTDSLKRKQLGSEHLRLAAETDCVFPATTATCIINDPALHRRILVEKSGSQTTVVWNPWIAKAAAMPDFGDDEWPQMLCIETANTGDDAITLAPGSTHSMSATISLR
ncbi:MAG: D-hexose-6-phosphate mutarotase [Chthoniobacteraceae bacterium]